MTPGRPRVEAEDLAVLAEGDDALLDAGAAGVQHADDGDAAAQRELHDLDDLLAGDLAERSAERREVLRVDGDRAAVDRADAGDDRVAVGTGLVHAERGRAVPHVLVELDEAAGVDEQLDALARGELALRVLLLLRRLLGVDDGLLVASAQVGDLAGGGARGRADRSRVPPYRRGSADGWRVRTRGRGIRCATPGVARRSRRAWSRGCAGMREHHAASPEGYPARRRGQPARPGRRAHRTRRTPMSCATSSEAPAEWPHLSLLLTTDQRAGRGRLDRTWIAPPGTALAVSVLVAGRRHPARRPAAGSRSLAGAAMTRAVARAGARHRAHRRAEVAERRAARRRQALRHPRGGRAGAIPMPSSSAWV